MKTSPAVANGVVYGVWGNGGLYALNASTGALLCNYQIGSLSTESSPAVANGVVYMGLWNGNLYAFDLTGGLYADKSARRSGPTRICCSRTGSFSEHTYNQHAHQFTPIGWVEPKPGKERAFHARPGGAERLPWLLLTCVAESSRSPPLFASRDSSAAATVASHQLKMTLRHDLRPCP